MIKRYRRGQAILICLSLLAVLFLGERPALVRAEGELSLRLSAYEVELSSGEAVTINVNYSADSAVQNTRVTLDRSQVAAFSIQDHLSESGNSVNGGGSLGSFTLIAPNQEASGTLILQAVATSANDSAVQYTAQAELALRVVLPQNVPAEAKVEVVPENIRVKLNGASEILPQVNVGTPEPLPEGYTEQLLDIQGKNVRSYQRSGRLPLVYLSLVPNGPPALYSYDEVNNSIYRFYPDIEMTIGGKACLIQSLIEPTQHSSFFSQTIDLNGQVTTAFIGESYGREYTLLNASIEGQAPQLFLYQLNAAGQAELLTYSLADLVRPPGEPSPLPGATNAAGSPEGSAGVTTATTAKTSSSAGGSLSATMDWIFGIMLFILLIMGGGLVWLFLRKRARNEAENRRRLREAYDHVQGGKLPPANERGDYQPLRSNQGRRYDQQGRSEQAGRGGRSPAQARQTPRPLRELTPNDFDDVDRYFAEQNLRQNIRGSDGYAPSPEVRSGVRRPPINSNAPRSGPPNQRYPYSNHAYPHTPHGTRPGQARPNSARPEQAYSQPRRSEQTYRPEAQNYSGRGGRSAPPPIRRVNDDRRNDSDYERF